MAKNIFDRKKEGAAFSRSLKSRVAQMAVRNIKIPELPASLNKQWDKKLKAAIKGKKGKSKSESKNKFMKKFVFDVLNRQSDRIDRLIKEKGLSPTEAIRRALK